MSGDGPERIHEDLLAQQAAFFESYFKKGAAFTRELMEETQRLRARLAELEQKLDGGRDQELEERFKQIEEENNDLAALYVAQSQLHSSLETSEVVQVISEILLNFVGVETFALMMLDKQGTLRRIASTGIAEGQPLDRVGSHESVATLMNKGGVSYSDYGRRGSTEEPVVALALGSRAGPYGVIVIWSFLQQKDRISLLDEQIFDLIANNGGLALQAARIVGEAQRKIRPEAEDGPFERFSRLLR